MKISKNIALAIEEDNDVKSFEIIEEGDWVQNGKYQDREIIFKDVSNNKFYALYSTRSGSPFTDWYYSSNDWSDEVEVVEVKKVEKITHEWVMVK